MLDWKIKVNPLKSQAIVFTRSRFAVSAGNIINDNPVPWNDTIKYLGLIFEINVDSEHHGCSG